MPSTDTRAALVERIRTAMIAERERQLDFGCEPGDEDFAHAIAAALLRSAPEERGEGLDPGKVAAQVLQSIADSEPDENTIEAQEILRGTPYEMMYVLNGDVIERHVAMAVENALEDALLASPPVPVEGERPTDWHGVYSADGRLLFVETHATNAHIRLGWCGFLDHAPGWVAPVDVHPVQGAGGGEREEMLVGIELAWGIIANASGGEWTRERPEWQGAARRWAHRFLPLLGRARAASPAPSAPEEEPHG